MTTLPNRPKDIDDIVAEERGLAILRTLFRQTGFSSSEDVMGRWLEQLALGGTRNAIRQELERLRELQVIKIEMRGHEGETMVFWLTERGLDYLEYRTQIDMLPRIGPGAVRY